MSNLVDITAINGNNFSESYTSAYEKSEGTTQSVSSGRTWSWLDMAAGATFIASVAAPLLYKDKTTMTVSALTSASSCLWLAVSYLSKNITSSKINQNNKSEQNKNEYETLFESIITARNELQELEIAKQKLIGEIDENNSLTSIIEQSKTAKKEIDGLNKLIIECQKLISTIENKLKTLKKGDDYQQIETKIKDAQIELDKREKLLEEALKARDLAKKHLDQSNDKQKNFNQQIHTHIKNLEVLATTKENLITERDELIYITDKTENKLEEVEETVKTSKGVLQTISTEDLTISSAAINNSKNDEKKESYFEAVENN